MIDTLIVLGRASEDQWLQRIQLAYQLDNLEEAHGIWEQGKIVLRSPEWNERAESLNRLLAELEENETPAILSRFRPSSDVPEFGAVPFGGGVVFVSTNEVPGIFTAARRLDWDEVLRVAVHSRQRQRGQPGTLWEKVKRTDLMKSGRSMFHDGPVGFSSEEDVAFVSRNHNEESSINGARTRHLRIDMMERKGDVWVPSEDTLAINDPSFLRVTGVLDTLGNLIFSSNRPGRARRDGFVALSAREDGTFGPPENGKVTNTSGNEVFPFVNSDQMYFSSNGREFPFGGLDVYKLVEGESEPVLLGQPVNSFADDFAIHVVGYFPQIVEDKTASTICNSGGLSLKSKSLVATMKWLRGFKSRRSTPPQWTSTARFRFKPSLVSDGVDVRRKLDVPRLRNEGVRVAGGRLNEDIIRLDYTPFETIRCNSLMEEVNLK